MASWKQTEVPMVPPMSRAKIEAEADRILRSVLPGALTDGEPIDIEEIFEIKLPEMFPGIRTGYCDLKGFGPGVMGYTSAKHKVCLVEQELYDLSCMPGARKSDVRRLRSTVSHEVSHAIGHYPFLEVFESANAELGEGALLRVEKRKNIPAYRDPEWQAWEMAMALLMPYERVVTDLMNGMDKYDLAELYDVNPAFAARRIISIGKQKR